MGAGRRPLAGFPVLPQTSPTCVAERHGNHVAYSRGCRCPHAREDWRLHRKRWREKRAVPSRVDSTGTARRMQALTWLGYSQVELGRLLGVSPRRAGELVRRVSPTVHRRTAAAVADLYRNLLVQPRPTGQAAAVARSVARRHGWHPPGVWAHIDDPAHQPDVGPPDVADQPDVVAVRRVLAGTVRLRDLTDVDRLAAYRLLAAQGLSDEQIRYRLRTNQAAITRLAALAADQPQTAAA